MSIYNYVAKFFEHGNYKLYFIVGNGFSKLRCKQIIIAHTVYTNMYWTIRVNNNN